MYIFLDPAALKFCLLVFVVGIVLAVIEERWG